MVRKRRFTDISEDLSSIVNKTKKKPKFKKKSLIFFPSFKDSSKLARNMSKYKNSC